ncbi:MAG: hypothetical protein HYU33_07475 [Candidatus Omnitrophica bacterium]|nr:hypothetical protein [Candidatus Omnitrophota bacterium]
MANFDSQALIKYLNEKWAGRKCAQCGVGNWQIQDSLFELRQFSGGGLVVGGPLIPVVPVTCANCGNTVLVNAILAGVLPKPEEVKK